MTSWCRLFSRCSLIFYLYNIPRRTGSRKEISTTLNLSVTPWTGLQNFAVSKSRQTLVTWQVRCQSLHVESMRVPNSIRAGINPVYNVHSVINTIFNGVAYKQSYKYFIFSWVLYLPWIRSFLVRSSLGAPLTCARRQLSPCLPPYATPLTNIQRSFNIYVNL